MSLIKFRQFFDSFLKSDNATSGICQRSNCSLCNENLLSYRNYIANVNLSFRPSRHCLNCNGRTNPGSSATLLLLNSATIIREIILFCLWSYKKKTTFVLLVHFSPKPVVLLTKTVHVVTSFSKAFSFQIIIFLMKVG